MATGQCATPAGTGVRHRRAPQSVVQCLSYPGVRGPVILQDTPEALAALNALMTGWLPEVTAVPAGKGVAAEVAPVSCLKRAGDRMALHSPWLDTPLQGLGVASAVCGVVADITQAFCNQHPDCFGLHCGAVQIGGQLVALTGPARAGKSTLISRLTAEPEMVVFCDDVLPVLQDGQAFALGLAPRLRLPLPDTVTEAFRAHVAAFMGPADQRYGYLCGPNIAAHGTRARLSVFILLARDADSPARLHQMEAAEAVQHLVRQNISAPGEGTGQFDQVTRLAENLICLRLVYSDLEDAVDLLRRAFGEGEGLSDQVVVAPPLPATLDPVAHGPADLARVYQRCAQVALRVVGTDLFLWHAQEHSYFHLNAVARAVWTMLEEPVSGEEIAGLLAMAFPDADSRQIRADVADLLGAFEAELLVEVA